MNGFLNLVFRKYIGPPHVAVPQAPTDQETALPQPADLIPPTGVSEDQLTHMLGGVGVARVTCLPTHSKDFY